MQILWTIWPKHISDMHILKFWIRFNKHAFKYKAKTKKIKGKSICPKWRQLHAQVTIIEVPLVPIWGWLGLEKGTDISPRTPQNWTPQKPCTPCHQHTQASKTRPGTIAPYEGEGGSPGKQMLKQFEVQEVYMWRWKEEEAGFYRLQAGGAPVTGRGKEAGARQDVDLAVSTSPTRWSRANAAHWRTPTLP